MTSDTEEQSFSLIVAHSMEAMEEGSMDLCWTVVWRDKAVDLGYSCWTIGDDSG